MDGLYRLRTGGDAVSNAGCHLIGGLPWT
jgi:hypothetical protein